MQQNLNTHPFCTYKNTKIYISIPLNYPKFAKGTDDSAQQIMYGALRMVLVTSQPHNLKTS